MAFDIIPYLIAAIIATALPTPTDVVHFYLQNYLYTHKHRRWVFESLQIFDWYVLDSLWFAFLLLIAVIFGLNDLSQVHNLTIIFTIIGIGATISIIWRFLRGKR